MNISRRGLFGVFAGLGAGLLTAPVASDANASAPALPPPEIKNAGLARPGALTLATLRKRLEKETYASWFGSLEFESFDGEVATFSVPVKFVRNWIREHYAEELLACAQVEFAPAAHVRVVYLQPFRKRRADRIPAAMAG